MGGYEGGQEASQLAVKTVSEVYRNADGSDVRSTLMEGLKTAHARIQEYAHEHPELAGMGTTCSAAALVGNQLYFAHVGDSRLYLVRGGSMSRLTRDDSYVSRLVESGLIRPEDAEVHPQRHILTAALGVGAEIRPECPDTPIDLEPDDVMVLCTDGLWGLVSDEELRQIVSDRPPAEACSELVELAREHGGPDNITVLVLRVAG